MRQVPQLRIILQLLRVLGLMLLDLVIRLISQLVSRVAAVPALQVMRLLIWVV